MSYKGLERHLVENVQAADVRQYLRAHQWRRVPDLPDEIAVFRREGGSQEVIVPMAPEFPEDYYRRMVEAICDIAHYEDRPPEEVLQDVLTGPADVVKFRVADPLVADGTILIEDGLNLFDGAKKALLASACSVVEPLAYYPRLSRSEASTFIKKCRIASEAGSFVARVICPLDAVASDANDDQMNLAEQTDAVDEGPSFTRQVTTTLMEALDALVKGTDRDSTEHLFEAPQDNHLSANLCDALLAMQPTGPDSSLTVASHWATSQRPRSTSTSAVQLRSEHFAVVEQLANDLRPKRKPEESSFIGTVDELSGSPGADGRRKGEVTLRLRDGEDLLTVKVNLSADDYAKAAQAHLENHHVKIWGTLRRRARVHLMKHYERIELLEDHPQHSVM